MPSSKRNRQPIASPPTKKRITSSMGGLVSTTGVSSSRVPLSPPKTPSPGHIQWTDDFAACKTKCGYTKLSLDGFCGLAGSISGFNQGTVSDSCRFTLGYEDIDGNSRSVELNLVLQHTARYPEAYEIVLSSHGPAPRGSNRVFVRFKRVYDLDIEALIERILYAFQGDDEANGGTQPEREDTDQEEDPELHGNEEDVGGSGLRYISVAEVVQEPDWTNLKRHFKQSKKMGYRPGLTKISDFWVVSLSIPLKNLPIDPNILMTWDDGLVDAWKADKRMVLLVKLPTYPPSLNQVEFYLGLDDKYKPSSQVISDTIARSSRDLGLPSFYLSSPLSSYLKSFSRALKIRTSFTLNWDAVDSVALDEEKSIQLFENNVLPASGQHDKDDPIILGYEGNLPLVAFWWTLRRFMKANQYCLNCGMEVAIPSLRPYVCDKPLCLYSYMSLGLGPSIEHTIINHPTVVDLLLSFAHAAVSHAAVSLPNNRMDVPLMLHIEVPTAFGIAESQLLDTLSETDMRRALAWLIERLPPVFEIKKRLESGEKLNAMSAYPGAVGVLRWVIGSCRAYLRESRPGEGVLAPHSDDSAENVRQFTFVVGSPEQETNFKQEIELAQSRNPNLAQYPTILAFHGTSKHRWHNILRKGLDFQEVANARAYGNGVYFASDNQTSLGYTALHRDSTPARANADFPLNSAVALVELVNVSSTFVSSNPYYVVGNTKQIKPFLLLVTGGAIETPSRAAAPGDLFKHDPQLTRQTTYNGAQVRVKIPQKLTRTTYVDDDSDHEDDKAVFHPPKPKAVSPTFKPSPESRFASLHMMRPPSGNTVGATRLLAKELKTIIAAQAKAELPFYIKPDSDELYCWVLELHDFPDSRLKEDMKQKSIHSVIAEMRFPENYPNAPPFMRILHPRFLPFSLGGGGNITAGGSICNEILTSTGWNITYTVEMIIRDIMVNMVCATPPARIDMYRWNQPYTMDEAMEAYKRVAAVHGWRVPKGFDKMAQ